MLINENRGSYGMFSRAGRNSTEKFHILMKKDEILNGTGRKFKPPDLFSQARDEALKYHIENQDEPQEIFLMEENLEEKQKEKKTILKHEKIFQYKKSDAYLEKFVDIRNKNKLLNLTPNCTKYDPRNHFIWKKSKHFPTWISSVPKTESKRPKEFIQPKFYKDTSFKVESKNFVDMSRQVDRKSFIEIKNYNTDSNYDENFVFVNNNNNDEFSTGSPNRIANKTLQGSFGNFHRQRKSLKSAGLLLRNKKLQLQHISCVSSEIDLQNANMHIDNNKLFYENNQQNNNNLDKPAENSANNMNANNINNNRNFGCGESSPTRKSISSMLKHRKSNKAHMSVNWNNSNNNTYNSYNNYHHGGNVQRSSRSANPLTSRRWNKIQAPDFKKIISRETREKVYDDKKRVMPFSIPPYQKTRPSQIFFCFF